MLCQSSPLIFVFIPEDVSITYLLWILNWEQTGNRVSKDRKDFWLQWKPKWTLLTSTAEHETLNAVRTGVVLNTSSGKDSRRYIIFLLLSSPLSECSRHCVLLEIISFSFHGGIFNWNLTERLTTIMPGCDSGCGGGWIMIQGGIWKHENGLKKNF